MASPQVTGEPITHLVVTGGGARSALWRQIIADVTGRAVVLVASTELTSLGAGMLAAAGAGAFPDVVTAAALAMTQRCGHGRPRPGHAGAATTRCITRAYRPLYPALREVTHALSALEQEGRWEAAEL